MKKGFKVYIQKDMLDTDKEVSKKFLDMFINKTTSDPRLRYFGEMTGGYTSGMWRGRYGREINFWTQFQNISKPIVFRRISSNTRKFACVYADTLVVKNDKYLDKAHDAYRDIVPNGEIPSMCKCSRHKGSIKVDWKVKPEFDLYYETGEYKG